MNRKLLITPIAVLVMMAASAATVFASGDKDKASENDDYGPWNGRGAYGRMMDDPRAVGRGGMPAGRSGGRFGAYGRDGRDWAERPEWETDVYQGKLSLEEGRLPELVTDEGNVYSLVVHFPIAAANLPDNGSEISVEAVEVPMNRRDWSGTDRYLMVVSAEVNGVELEPNWPENAPYGGGPGRRFGGAGMTGGMYRGAMHGGLMYSGRRPFGGWGNDSGEASE